MGTGDRRCQCKRIDASPSCEGEVMEDPKCKAFCWKAYCQCPVQCGIDHTGD